jgi:hypothetical protein
MLASYDTGRPKETPLEPLVGAGVHDRLHVAQDEQDGNSIAGKKENVPLAPGFYVHR